ncbi:MAG TPA: patatin-like phospholipase family protein [Rubrivivax sp.]|nr:patatin-like phospholipase family protein [Rubrivivax sp.]
MSPHDDARPLPHAWADALRGGVRLMFPLASLLVLIGLIYSAQGRDVLRALVSDAAIPQASGDHVYAGLIFLLAASAALSLSVWYASRWLLTAQMAALPLPAAGPWQTWLPRVLGFAAPLAIALGLATLHWRRPALQQREVFNAFAWAAGFVALAALLLLFYWQRGRLLDRLGLGHGPERRRDPASGANQPSQLAIDAATPRPTQRVMIWAVALSFAVAGLLILFPVTLPRMIGAAAVAAFALASINLFGSFVLTYVPLRRALPPLWIWVVLAAGVLLARCNDNHVVQAAAGAAAAAPAAPDAPDAYEAFARALPPDGKVLFVASEGGGIRAAYWTAAVLDELYAADPALMQRIRLLSGVSGGSLGVAAWLASHRRDYCPGAPAAASTAVGLRSPAPPSLAASTALASDFVAPAVAGMFYGDLMQRFLPVAIGPLDRSRAIESAWQRAFEHLPGQPFAHTLDAFYAGCPALPQLVLNATRVETGERVALTRLPTDGSMFVNTFDAMRTGSAARSQSLAGLVHHSARFPVVSPAGTVPVDEAPPGVPPDFRLVDGGYFDNSGVHSALDVIEALQQHPGMTPFTPLLIVIRNEREPLERPCPHPQGVSRLFPEAGSIVLALAHVRGSHAITARGSAKRRLGADLIDIVVPQEEAVAPLGWALSAASRAALDKGAQRAAAQALPLIRSRLSGSASPAVADVGCPR